MRRVEFMHAMRAYDNAKERLAAAEENMQRVRVFAKVTSTLGYTPSLFTMNEQFIIDTISEFKKAYAAYQDLFVDRESLHELEILRKENLAKTERDSYHRRFMDWQPLW